MEVDGRSAAKEKVTPDPSTKWKVDGRYLDRTES